MSYAATEQQLDAAGFMPNLPALPFVLRGYEKALPNGNLLTFGRPGVAKARHLATEFLPGRPIQAVAIHIIENDHDLAESAAGRGRLLTQLAQR